MTCAEFKDPKGFTTAERGAFLGHTDDCQACDDWFEGISEAALRLLLREAPDMLPGVDKQALELAEKDFSDPEFMQ